MKVFGCRRSLSIRQLSAVVGSPHTQLQSDLRAVLLNQIGRIVHLNFALLNTQTLKIILLLSIATLVCAALHWLVGLAQRRIALRFASATKQDDGAPPTIRRLLLDWSGKALRTLVWVIYSTFLINVLPQTRERFGGVGGNLRRIGG